MSVFYTLSSTPLISKQSEFTVHLGELEKLVLNYLWTVGSADAKQVHDHFKKSRGGSLNTIQSTLDRLHKKAILMREKQGHAYQYRAAMEKKAFLGELIRTVTQDFSSYHDHLLAAFVSLSADLDEAHLDRLEALIQDSRQQKKDEAL
ncbi:BlaI/MecI/CopY family transcriptional regulator [Cellvibrio sp.]